MGATWKIRLNDPCAAPIRAVATIKIVSCARRGRGLPSTIALSRVVTGSLIRVESVVVPESRSGQLGTGTTRWTENANDDKLYLFILSAVGKRLITHCCVSRLACSSLSGQALSVHTACLYDQSPGRRHAAQTRLPRSLSHSLSSGRRHGVDWGGQVHPTFARGRS